MSRWLCLGFVSAAVMAGCHTVYPFDIEKDSGPPDASSVETGSDRDGPANDAATDTVPWPTWDLGGAMCKKLVVWGPPVQVSDENAKSGRSPSIVGVGDTFYIAFVEGENVYVRKIKATAQQPLSTLSKPLSSTGSSDAGTVAPAKAPWIVYNSNANRVAVAWHNMNTNNTCSSDLRFRDVTLDSALSLGAECRLTQASNPYGYHPVSMIYDPTTGEYIIASPLQWSGYPCNGHAKAKVFNFSACSQVSSGYTSTISPLLCTQSPVITRFADGYFLVRLYDATCNAGATTALLNAHVSTGNPASWSAPAGFTQTEISAINRPALVAEGVNSVLVAFTTDTYTIKAMRYTGATAMSSPFSLPGNAKDPFLARKHQEGGVATSARTVLVYAETTAQGTTTSSIKLAEVQSSSFNPIHDVATTSTANHASWNPRTPAVAAGANGFGVTWVENVGTEHSEVLFQWVGCQP